MKKARLRNIPLAEKIRMPWLIVSQSWPLQGYHSSLMNFMRFWDLSGANMVLDRIKKCKFWRAVAPREFMILLMSPCSQIHGRWQLPSRTRPRLSKIRDRSQGWMCSDCAARPIRLPCHWSQWSHWNRWVPLCVSFNLVGVLKPPYDSTAHFFDAFMISSQSDSPTTLPIVTPSEIAVWHHLPWGLSLSPASITLPTFNQSDITYHISTHQDFVRFFSHWW